MQKTCVHVSVHTLYSVRIVDWVLFQVLYLLSDQLYRIEGHRVVTRLGVQGNHSIN